MRTIPIGKTQAGLAAFLALAAAGWAAWPTDSFRFAILGDRTGGVVEGVFEEALHEVDLDRPAFIVTVGDAIQGGNDATVNDEWDVVRAIIAPYRRYRFYFTPGNHDVWSETSLRAYIENSKHPLHYSFDYQQAHFTVLNNSRQDDLSGSELEFLEKDLIAHKEQPVKFIFSHRPSWILQAVLGNPAFRLHQIAKKYGVQYVIAGHIHQMLHFEVDGVAYLSMASSGGHLRDSKSYERGWFFQHSLVEISGSKIKFQIKELNAPYGKGRSTVPDDWGAAGLIRR